ncbi:MAG: hypothetical protein GXP58_01995 [Deltaproteobacteria bacterium]|nr:hypothetical protein [Deltaproteobacteria bacterium]
MLKQEFTLKSPMRILQKATQGGLGKGNLGVFMARAGVGKTACLIHVALDSLFKNQKAVHVGIGESVEEIRLWYREILSDLCTGFEIQNPEKLSEELERQRIILSYTPETFTVRKLALDLEDLAKDGGFLPEILLIDGFDFEKEDSGWDTLAAFEYLAKDRSLEVWFSARTHRDSKIINERGIPAPCHEVDDLFSVIIFLEPKEAVIQLKLLKDHDHPVEEDLPLRLNPNTFLLMDE